jgi:hypothetical protein
MMQEVERAFWRENPPLPDYAAPLAGAEPDPAMNSDPRLLQDRFNDKQMGSSAVERMLEEIARHPGIGIYLRHPGLLLQYAVFNRNCFYYYIYFGTLIDQSIYSAYQGPHCRSYVRRAPQDCD